MLIFPLLLSVFGLQVGHAFDVIAQWTVVDYAWDEAHTYSDYINSSKFQPTKCAITGIVVGSRGDIFLSVPRWFAGVPATLNKLVQSIDGSGDYVLSPYPSWDTQVVGEVGDLQNCQAMTLDSKGVMFAIEVGRRNFFEADTDLIVDGTPGVWQIDTTTNEILSKYYFPESVASSSDSFVNDIVLDEKRSFAYLTDAWGDGAIISYDYVNGVSKRYTGTSTQRDPSYALTVNGINYGTDTFTTPVDGIAISDDGHSIFYCHIQKDLLYRLPTEVLRDFSLTDDVIDAAVEILGKKEPSDGMMYWGGQLYWGSLPESTYYALKVDATSSPNLNTSVIPAWPDAVQMRWIDTFAIDWSDSNKLWFVSNRLDLFMQGTMDFSGEQGANFRVISTSATASTTSSGNDDNSSNKKWKIAVGVIGCLLVATVLALVLALVALKKKTKTPMANEL